MKTTSIELQSLEKNYLSLRGKVSALKSIDLHIRAGEFFVLLGPSGCGKSTLLSLLAGLEKPTSGSITFGERIVADPTNKKFVTPFERDISMVFQSYALYPHMSIAQNIAFPLTNIRKNKPSKKSIKETVEAVAQTLKITDLLNRKPSELSGGQRQRVAIGRAIVRKPQIFLMDEPLSNLDAKLRSEMRAQLKDLQQNLGITTVYVTHDQLEAMTLGDRMAIIEDGYIQQVGSPVDVYQQPENTFIARFIGSPPMNILYGDLAEHNGQTVFKCNGQNIALPLQFIQKMKDAGDTRYALGIRPEEVKLHAPGQGDINVQADLVENIGAELLINTFNFEADGNFIIKTTQMDVKNHQAISLSFPEDKLHLFSANKAGKRI